MRLRLREWRRRRLLTQADLAKRVGTSVGTINRIERGIHEPRLSTIRKIAEALDVSPEELVDWSETDEEGEGNKDQPADTLV